MAREYPVKKGIKMSAEYILDITKKVDSKAEIKGDHVIASIPGMKVIDLSTNGKTLLAETQAEDGNADFSNTIRTYNNLIEDLTGFNSKERKKRFSKL